MKSAPTLPVISVRWQHPTMGKPCTTEFCLSATGQMMSRMPEHVDWRGNPPAWEVLHDDPDDTDAFDETHKVLMAAIAIVLNAYYPRLVEA